MTAVTSDPQRVDQVDGLSVERRPDPAAADMTIEDLAAESRRIMAELAEMADQQRRDDETWMRKRRARAEAWQTDARTRLAELAASVPAQFDGEDLDVEPWSTVSEHRAELFRRIWEGDLKRELVTDLAVHGFADAHPLGAAQGKAFIEAIGPDAPKRNLILAGDVGTGKSSLALALGAMAVDRGLLTRFVSHLAYVRMLQPGQQPSGMSEFDVRARYVHHTDLLILDDFGAEMEGGASDHAAKATVELLQGRLNSGRATIFTTNLSSASTAEILGKRIYSRIGGASHPIRMTGEDRRQPPVW